MNINEATKSEKIKAIVSEVSHLDENAIDEMLIEFFGWTDDEDSKDYDLETDTKDHP